ncbi:hypothetical protein [Acinetobacter guillouiae]|uniref:hypothetical protein n=1 Tax=Acinetobacter guillouiae TaxID=106649 RepID=UPI003C6EAFA4
MGFFSWLFGTNKKEPEPKKPQKKKRGVYGFDDRRESNRKTLLRDTSSPYLKIKKVKIVVDKDDLDTCSAIKRMRKVYNINEVPEIPLDREKCQHCTCYYEPVIPKVN